MRKTISGMLHGKIKKVRDKFCRLFAKDKDFLFAKLVVKDF